MSAAAMTGAEEYGAEERAFDRVYASNDGGRFNALWSGDWDGYHSKSDADFALAVMVFRAFGDDQAKAEQFLRESNVNPTKYARRDYLDRTLRAALARARKLGTYPVPSQKQLVAWNSKTALEEGTAAEVQARATAPAPLRLLTPEELKDPSLLEVPEALSPWLAWRGELTLLVGREKLAGKSTLAASDAARSGRPFLWLSAEESRGRVVKRLADLGVPYDRMLVPDRWPRSWEEVEALLAEHRPAVAYVDSLASFLMAVDGRVPDTSEGEAWQAKVLRFKAWTERGTGAVVVLLHATKGDGSYRGSTGIGAAPDTIITMREVDGDATARRLEAIGRWGFPSRGVRFWGDAEGYEDVELGRPSDVDENARLVIQAYEPGMTTQDWRTATGLSQTTFYRVRRAAMEERDDGTWIAKPTF